MTMSAQEVEEWVERVRALGLGTKSAICKELGVSRTSLDRMLERGTDRKHSLAMRALEDELERGQKRLPGSLSSMARTQLEAWAHVLVTQIESMGREEMAVWRSWGPNDAIPWHIERILARASGSLPEFLSDMDEYQREALSNAIGLAAHHHARPAVTSLEVSGDTLGKQLAQAGVRERELELALTGGWDSPIRLSYWLKLTRRLSALRFDTWLELALDDGSGDAARREVASDFYTNYR